MYVPMYEFKEILRYFNFHSQKPGRIYNYFDMPRKIISKVIMLCNMLFQMLSGTPDRNEMPVANSLLTEEELKSLTLEAFKSQVILNLITLDTSFLHHRGSRTF